MRYVFKQVYIVGRDIQETQLPLTKLQIFSNQLFLNHEGNLEFPPFLVNAWYQEADNIVWRVIEETLDLSL